MLDDDDADPPGDTGGMKRRNWP